MHFERKSLHYDAQPRSQDFFRPSLFQRNAFGTRLFDALYRYKAFEKRMDILCRECRAYTDLHRRKILPRVAGISKTGKML